MSVFYLYCGAEDFKWCPRDDLTNAAFRGTITFHNYILISKVQNVISYLSHKNTLLNCVHFSVNQDTQSIFAKLFCIRLASRLHCWMGLFHVRYMAWICTCKTLNFVGFPSVHFFSLLLSKTAALCSSGSTIPLLFDFLSENSLVVQSVPLSRSSIRMVNIPGTSITLWGMPLVISCELRFVCWLQCVTPTGTLVPLFSDHFGGFVCLAGIVPRTLLNTRYAASSVLPLSKTQLDMYDLCLKQQL